MNHITFFNLVYKDKIMKSPFNKKGEHATETLVMIHLDVCEPMSCIQEEDILTL